MGKLDVKMLRYLSPEYFRVLTAIEMGMKNHEIVNEKLVAQLANLHHGGMHNILKKLCEHRLLTFEKDKKCLGYRLTNSGYDYLALRTLAARDLIDSFGNQIGVGKESNIYVVSKGEEDYYVLKLHRLGRVCFKTVKINRDYFGKRKHMNWLYMSRVSAKKEFAFMNVLYERGFSVPKPIDINRHCIIMELIDGVPLCNVNEVENVEKLYDELMNTICRLADHGVIHGDFNEFNIMLAKNEKPVIIDFPQMISIQSKDAKYQFERDVQCIRTFFKRRFSYESTLYPKFEEIVGDRVEEYKKIPHDLLLATNVSDDEDDDFRHLNEEYSKNTVEKSESEDDELNVDEEESCSSIVQEEDDKEYTKKPIEVLINKIDELNIDVQESHLPTVSENKNDRDDQECIKKSIDESENKVEEFDLNTQKNKNFNISSNEEVLNENEEFEPDMVPDAKHDFQQMFSIHNTNRAESITSERTDLFSVASTIIPEDLVKKRVKSELLKKDKKTKKAQTQRNIRKSGILCKNRRENKSIARENTGLWGED